MHIANKEIGMYPMKVKTFFGTFKEPAELKLNDWLNDLPRGTEIIDIQCRMGGENWNHCISVWYYERIDISVRRWKKKDRSSMRYFECPNCGWESSGAYQHCPGCGMAMLVLEDDYK